MTKGTNDCSVAARSARDGVLPEGHTPQAGQASGAQSRASSVDSAEFQEVPDPFDLVSFLTKASQRWSDVEFKQFLDFDDLTKEVLARCLGDLLEHLREGKEDPFVEDSEFSLVALLDALTAGTIDFRKYTRSLEATHENATERFQEALLKAVAVPDAIKDHSSKVVDLRFMDELPNASASWR